MLDVLKELISDLWAIKEIIAVGLILWGAFIYGLFDGSIAV